MNRKLRTLLLASAAGIFVQPVKADPIITPLVAAAIGSATAGVTIGAATISFASIISGVITTGALFGLSQLFAPSSEAPKYNESQLQVKQSMPELVGGYGETKLGGSQFFYETASGVLVSGIIHCGGPIDSFTRWYLNDRLVLIPAGTPFNTGYGGGVRNPVNPFFYTVIESHLGLIPERANTTLMQHFPGEWTEQHRLDGLATSVVRFAQPEPADFTKVYPQGSPVLFVYARMFRVYDPRDPAQDFNNPATFKFSKNTALHILHYLTETRRIDPQTGRPSFWGFGIPKNKINLEAFKRFANICSQIVPQKDGTGEPRYTSGGTFNMAKEQRRSVLAKLLACCDGEIYMNGAGLIGIRGGIWDEPTVTITDAAIRNYSLNPQPDKDTIFNRLTTSFSDPKNDYQIVPGDPWNDTALQDKHRGVIEQDLSLPYVQSHSQMRRLAKIATRKANAKRRLTITTNILGLRALGQRAIRLQISELMIDTTFLVTRFVELADGDNCIIDVMELGAEDYEFDPVLEEGTPPAVTKSVKPPIIIPDISGLALTQARTISGGVVVALQINAKCDTLSDPTWKMRAQFREYSSNATAESGWIYMDEAAVNNLLSRPINDGLFQVRVAAQAAFNGTLGPWSNPIDIQMTSDPVAPNVPPALTIANSVAGATRFNGTNSDSANAKRVRLYRSEGSASSFTSAILIQDRAASPNQSLALADETSVKKLYKYYATSVNGSGVSSLPTDPLLVDLR